MLISSMKRVLHGPTSFSPTLSQDLFNKKSSRYAIISAWIGGEGVLACGDTLLLAA